MTDADLMKKAKSEKEERARRYTSQTHGEAAEKEGEDNEMDEDE